MLQLDSIMPSHLESGIQSISCTGKSPDSVDMMCSGTSDEVSERKSGGECVTAISHCIAHCFINT